jgi:hypothetical protein
MSWPWASPTRPSTPCPSPCTDLALMDCAFWKNLPAPATPVNAIQIHPDFHQNLCQRLERLRDQILARNELLSKDVLEYRFGHNPPGFYDHDKTQQFVKEYIQYLEPPTPPNPTTSASVSISSPKTLSISRSSPHHIHQTMPSSPAPSNQYQQRSKGTRLRRLWALTRSASATLISVTNLTIRARGSAGCMLVSSSTCATAQKISPHQLACRNALLL